MDPNDIKTLYAYNRWANERMFAAIAPLSEPQLTRDLGSSFSSIRETVFHIVAAEWIWLKRWQGTSPTARPDAEQYPTMEKLKSFWEAVDRERDSLLGGLDDARLRASLAFQDLAGTPYSMPLVELMQHLANHSTYHRGQVTTMLRQVGAKPVALDMLYFFRDVPHQDVRQRA